MIIALIVAMDENGGIGKNGRLPWRLNADLKRFKELTWGHHLIMGRVTYQSIGKLLPGRTSVVISRSRKFDEHGFLLAGSLQEALKMVLEAGEQEVFVIGGSQIFSLALPIADRIYLTRVHALLDCDVYFPNFNVSEWVIKEQVDVSADAKNEFNFTYFKLERNGIR